MLHILRFLLVVLVALWVLPVAAGVSDQLAIVVNALDPQSRLIADYYQKKRGIPDANIIVVEFPVRRGRVMSKERFQLIYEQVRTKTPGHVQFYALAWSNPIRVSCMSITSAFTFGFDEKYCAKGCRPTELSPYYNSISRKPYDDLSIRPSMMLAGSSIEQVYKMIDRGVRSDGSNPNGTAYLVSTTDKARNVRSNYYSLVKDRLGGRIGIRQVTTDALKNKNDVLFYFTGLVKVDDIGSNRFIDGAIADHLTSSGGILFDGGQMSILRWLDAGATASYGTVIEPCAFTQKFPNPVIVIDHYTRGETLIESYWKSVFWPGQGIFVGEPLAAPFLMSSFSKGPVKNSVNHPLGHPLSHVVQ